MLQKILRKCDEVNAYRFLLLIIVLIALPVYAQNQGSPIPQVQGLSAESMLVKIASQIPSLMKLITAVAYVLGMYFIINGVVQLKHFGESRTMMSHEHSLKGPIIYIVVGTALLYLPTTVSVGLNTFWTYANPYGYTQQQDEWSQFINIVFVIVQFVGAIAFIRGLIIMTHLGGHGGQHGEFGKGLTHIIGGIFCINIYQFVQVIMATLGLSVS